MFPMMKRWTQQWSARPGVEENFKTKLSEAVVVLILAMDREEEEVSLHKAEEVSLRAAVTGGRVHSVLAVTIYHNNWPPQSTSDILLGTVQGKL